MKSEIQRRQKLIYDAAVAIGREFTHDTEGITIRVGIYTIEIRNRLPPDIRFGCPSVRAYIFRDVFCRQGLGSEERQEVVHDLFLSPEILPITLRKIVWVLKLRSEQDHADSNALRTAINIAGSTTSGRWQK